MADHKTEAEQAATAGKWDIANYHATMRLADEMHATNLHAAIIRWGGDEQVWPLAIRESLGLA